MACGPPSRDWGYGWMRPAPAGVLVRYPVYLDCTCPVPSFRRSTELSRDRGGGVVIIVHGRSLSDRRPSHQRKGGGGGGTRLLLALVV